jgi:hypothetical protein
MAMESGARPALIPLENKRNFLDVSGDTVERVDPVFYSDPQTVAWKALAMKSAKRSAGVFWPRTSVIAQSMTSI